MNDLIATSPSLWTRVARVLAFGLLGGVLVTAAGLAAHQVAQDESFRVYEVDFRGNHRATAAQLRHLADVQQGAHLATVDLQRIRRGIERHPWVAHANVRRRFPSAIEVTVSEYEPVLLLALDQLWYVDGAGRPIKPADSSDLDYPVLTGMDPDLAQTHPALARAVVHGALRVLSACTGDPVGPRQVSEIHFDAQSGYALVLRDGSRLLVGNGDPTAALARLHRLQSAGLDLDTPTRVDLAVETVAVATPLPPLESRAPLASLAPHASLQP